MGVPSLGEFQNILHQRRGEGGEAASLSHGHGEILGGSHAEHGVGGMDGDVGEKVIVCDGRAGRGGCAWS